MKPISKLYIDSMLDYSSPPFFKSTTSQSPFRPDSVNIHSSLNTMNKATLQKQTSAFPHVKSTLASARTFSLYWNQATGHVRLAHTAHGQGKPCGVPSLHAQR